MENAADSLSIVHPTVHGLQFSRYLWSRMNITSILKAWGWWEGRQETGVGGQVPWKQTLRLAGRKSASSLWARKDKEPGWGSGAVMKPYEVLIDFRDILGLPFKVVLNRGWADQALELPRWPITGCCLPVARTPNPGQAALFSWRQFQEKAGGPGASYPVAGSTNAPVPKGRPLRQPGFRCGPGPGRFHREVSNRALAVNIWLNPSTGGIKGQGYVEAFQYHLVSDTWQNS